MFSDERFHVVEGNQRIAEGLAGGLPEATLRSVRRLADRRIRLAFDAAGHTVVETSLQLSIYSYAAEMGGLANQGEARLRFDVLTKTKQPELHRYWTS